MITQMNDSKIECKRNTQNKWNKFGNNINFQNKQNDGHNL